MPEFQPWPKIARLNRHIVITEKIDGTNAAIGIIDHDPTSVADGGDPFIEVYGQSRTRIVTPEADNYGFAAWVKAHSDSLIRDLGPGLHFGEWWGKGIQRNYGLDERRFSLFNARRFGQQLDHEPFETEGLGVVPVLYDGPFNTREATGLSRWDEAIDNLAHEGSVAAPGFMRPEGIVVFFAASSTMYKVTLENDAAPKGLVA